MHVRRVSVAVSLLVCWLAVWGFVLRNDVASNADLDAVARRLEDQDPRWAREDAFYAAANLDRTGAPLQLPVRPPSTAPEFRVLVLGDSFTVGQGMVDLDARWSSRLQLLLDEAYGTGKVEVVTLARRGASLATYAGWLQDLRDGRMDRLTSSDSPNARPLPNEVTESLRRPFDLILLGYVENDLIPSSEDWFIPEGSYVPVPPDSEFDILSGKAPNPNEEVIRSALEFLVSSAPGGNLAVLPLVTVPVDRSELYGRFDLVRSLVPYVADNAAQISLGSRFKPERLMVTPVDTHPNSAHHAAIALDALEALRRFLPQNPSPEMSSGLPGQMFSTMLPAPSSVTDDGTFLVVEFDGDPTPAGCAEIQSGPGRVHRCNPPRAEIEGRDYPPQYVPCARLGVPHAIMLLNPALPAGTEVRLVVVSAVPLRVYAFGYDSDRFEILTPLELDPDGTGMLRTGSASVGIVLVDPSGTCDLNDQVRLPAFTVRLEAR